MSNSYLETIRSVDGEIMNISYHQKRYESVLKELGCEDIKDLKEYLDPPPYGVYRCRLLYTKDTIDVTYHEYQKRDIYSLKLIFNNNIEYSKKSANRDELESMFESRGEADDILIIKNLFVTDTSIANIAFYKDGLWVTPRNPLLKGTTRQRFIDEGQIIEEDIKVQELRSFSRVALLNAMIGFDVLEECEFLI